MTNHLRIVGAAGAVAATYFGGRVFVNRMSKLFADPEISNIANESGLIGFMCFILIEGICFIDSFPPPAKTRQ